jgi:hypothetical protein
MNEMLTMKLSPAENAYYEHLGTTIGYIFLIIVLPIAAYSYAKNLAQREGRKTIWWPVALAVGLDVWIAVLALRPAA